MKQNTAKTARVRLKRCPQICLWVPQRRMFVLGYCSQCGKRFEARACGPTHAVLGADPSQRVTCRRCKGAGMVTA